MKHIIPGLLCLLLVACGSSGFELTHPDVEVEIINQSSYDLENATAQFGEFDCQWGWVSRGATKAYLFYPHPVTARAELRWDQDKKPQSRGFDLTKIFPGKSGRLTFTVYDDRADVIFVPK